MYGYYGYMAILAIWLFWLYGYFGYMAILTNLAIFSLKVVFGQRKQRAGRFRDLILLRQPRLPRAGHAADQPHNLGCHLQPRRGQDQIFRPPPMRRVLPTQQG